MKLTGPPPECRACVLAEMCRSCPYAPPNYFDLDAVKSRLLELTEYWLLTGGPLEEILNELGIDRKS